MRLHGTISVAGCEGFRGIGVTVGSKFIKPFRELATLLDAAGMFEVGIFTKGRVHQDPVVDRAGGGTQKVSTQQWKAKQGQSFNQTCVQLEAVDMFDSQVPQRQTNIASSALRIETAVVGLNIG